MTGTVKRIQTRCAWCRRFQTADGWADENPRPELELTHGICPDCYAPVSRGDWPIHQPEAPDAPIPGRHWYAGCEPGGDYDPETGSYHGTGPRVDPETGVCEGCGATACKTCGKENCPNHNEEATPA